MVTPTINPKTTDDCFSFYYYIYGEGARYIELDLQSDGANIPLWIRKSSAGDMWHLKRITIPKQTKPFKVNDQILCSWEINN